MPTEPAPRPACGWESDLPTFRGTPSRSIVLRLQDFVRDAGPEQLRAWGDSLPWLQEQCSILMDAHTAARAYTAILEYELPYESRRPDVVVLEDGSIVVLEIKGYAKPSRAALDQVAAYARDLRCYHSSCADRAVYPVLVPRGGPSTPELTDGVIVVGPTGVHRVLEDLAARHPGLAPSPEEFLRPEAYAPLPSLVRAARDIFDQKKLPWIQKARATTDPAIEAVAEVARLAAATATRHLVLLTGVPGAGKTLVGLSLVHAGFLDDLAVPRPGGRPQTPAVFLSGNGPLVSVLQDALKDAGGGGKTFVRGVKDYVKYYTKKASAVPPEHLLVFDEAQRAFDAAKVASKHEETLAGESAKSEPELFVQFAERIPDWCVVLGLIGEGQEIHQGEEGGLIQWRQAVEGSPDPGRWTVHVPPGISELFHGSTVRTHVHRELNLDSCIRYHLSPKVHEFVRSVLERDSADLAADLAVELRNSGHRWLVTRDLEAAKAYARERYADHPTARYGLLASSKAKNLEEFGVDNSWMTTSRLSNRIGPWYNADPKDPGSCCQFGAVATEFSSQGLELDLALLAWGGDFARKAGDWSMERSRGTRGPVRDPMTLRRNVYRVLMTRGRDGTVIYVPADPVMDETSQHLLDCGMIRL